MKIAKKTIILPGVVLILCLVAWSPTPSTDDVVVGSTTTTSPSGQILVVGTGSYGKAWSALVVGKTNAVSAQPGQSERLGSIIAGNMNIVDASTTLVSGTNNEAASVLADETRNSCLIGANHDVFTAHGYAIGYNHVISGDYGSALGYGLNLDLVTNKTVALGRWNGQTFANDVLVVGTGSSATVRNTSLRATSEGNLILGSATSGTVVLAKAQGDISMGDYAN